MRACIRASSSLSSCFFFRRASRAACWAALVEEDGFGDDDESWGVAFCFPFAFEDGGSTEETGLGCGGVGVEVVTAGGVGVNIGVDEDV